MIGKSYKHRKMKGGGSYGQYSFDVTAWKRHAEGGIFTRPTLLGGGRHLVGEALNTFWKQLGQVMTSNSKESNGNININLNYDASSDASALLKDIARGVKRYRMAGVI